MTQNQIAYQNLQEQRRRNRADEEIRRFSNDIALGNAISKPIVDVLSTVLRGVL